MMGADLAQQSSPVQSSLAWPGLASVSVSSRVSRSLLHDGIVALVGMVISEELIMPTI
jgi:hypothetical protein